MRERDKEECLNLWVDHDKKRSLILKKQNKAKQNHKEIMSIYFYVRELKKVRFQQKYNEIKNFLYKLPTL